MLLLLARSARRRFVFCTSQARRFSQFNQGSPLNAETDIRDPHNFPPPAVLPHQKPLLSPIRRSLPFYALSVAAASATAVACAVALLSSSDPDSLKRKSEEFYTELEQSLEKSNHSVQRVFNRIRQTGVAASVLWKSLRSVLSSANQEVRSGFELRVAALVADIVAASESRRWAIVGAGGGAVVDWLLETVASSRNGTQAESARALACLIADPNVCGAVLGRPHAVPNLLRFIFSFQPNRSKKQAKRNAPGAADTCKGRSLLVAAIMDVTTSDCELMDLASYQPKLPGHANIADIAAALQVIEEGGIHFDDPEDTDEDGSEGLRGIGLKLFGGTKVVGFSRTNGPLQSDQSAQHAPSTLVLQKNSHDAPLEVNLASVTTPGLWDDLQREHVAVPFAMWAVANWAMASDFNRSHIQELDRDGHAIMTALMAAERSVKWHANLVARLLLEDQNLPLTDSVPEWSSSFLSTIFQASLTDDVALANMALSAFLVSLERSDEAMRVVKEKGLDLMRKVSKQTQRHKHMQEGLAKALELVSTGDSHLSLEESYNWSTILFNWVSGYNSTDATRFSAIKILSYILEDYGHASVPISQWWLTILLTESLRISKMATSKGSSPPRTDKVKTQIVQSNAQSASQTANQLAQAVVNLAAKQLRSTTNFDTVSPPLDFLSVEPFVGLLKNMKEDKLQKFDAADSAVATLKGIKSLTEICAEDDSCQSKIVDLGVLCLLRRLLLKDDYEKFAAAEAYDASRISENHGQSLPASGESSDLKENANDAIRVRVPPTPHIRKHAARLLTILSLLPEVQKVIVKDKVWWKWLEDCAIGSIAGCNDPKLQSYAKATLLNVFCNQKVHGDVLNEESSNIERGNRRKSCPRYDDWIFLVNPELPHWRCPVKSGSTPKGGEDIMPDLDISESSCSDVGSKMCSHSVDPLLDIVFVHGLRGGPFKTWRITDDKVSTTSKSGLVERIDQEAGKEGTCWPREWLASDFPHARVFTVKYKTNLTQWSGASLPLQEVSSMLLKKLDAAGVGSRPVVFVTHSLGGLVVKQMLYQAKQDNFKELLDNAIGVVFYSCPHFGSRLADMPWRMGLVFRPAPTVGDLRSGSPRLVDLNDFLRQRHNKGLIDVLSFSETQVTPIVEGYGGWAFRLEIVPIESAYPGFGNLVVLDATDHVNSCKPVTRTDLSYSETLAFLQKLKAQCN